MEITLEQVERLRAKADVSYAKAKEALEYSGENLLDALIYLEEQGVIPRPEKSYYSTKGDTPPMPEQVIEMSPEQEQTQQEGKKKKTGLFNRLRYLLLDNELEVWRKDKPVIAMPVFILILLVGVAFYVVLPLLAVGLFFGFRYRFSGPDLEKNSINSVISNVADTASDVGRQVMDELRSQHERFTKGNKDDEQ